MTNVLFADGSVKTLDFAKLKPETIKALFTIAGGEITNLDERLAPKPAPIKPKDRK